MAYLGFEIAGANKKFSRCVLGDPFFIDRFLYTVSYKPILSVIDLIRRPKILFSRNLGMQFRRAVHIQGTLADR